MPGANPLFPSYPDNGLPLVIVNFKTYEAATGARAVRLAEICERVSRKHEIVIMISPQYTDIYRICRESSISIPVFAQHIDDKIGQYTGSVSPIAVKEAGASGTLLNHSEKRIPIQQVGDRIAAARSNGLLTLCFADSMVESRKIAAFGPDMLAYEPPELVGTGISVSSVRPGEITEFVRGISPKVKRLVGAGITSGGDAAKSVELGADGFGVSSAVTKSKDPEKTLVELVEASIRQTKMR